MSAFLVVLDVDSTLIEEEVIDLLAAEAGTQNEVREITRLAMNGQMDFARSLTARVETLRGLPHTVFETVGATITVTTGADELVAAVTAAGGQVGVVSGGFHEVLDPIATRLRLHRWRANRLGVLNGVLTGRLVGPVVDGEAKARALREWAVQLQIPLSRTVVVGDGANDLQMMAIAGLAVGFDAKAPVRDVAGVIIDDRDLSQVLPLLGLRG